MENSRERMIDGVNKVIAQRLLSSDGVYLPSIGSIVVKLKSAEVAGSKKSVAPPMRKLDFSSSEQGVSLIQLIMESAECNAEQAEELYNSYLGEIRTPTGVVIDGVGTLIDKSFVGDKDFMERLNPQADSGAVVIQNKPKKGGDNLLFIALILALVAGVAVYLLFNYFTKEDVVESVVEVVEVAPEPEPMPEPEPEPVVKSTRYGVTFGVYSTPENVARSKGEIAEIFGNNVEITTYPYFTKTVVVIFESESKREAQNFLNTNYDIISDSWVYEIK